MKKNGQARLVYVKALTATSPVREGEPVGTADTSRLHYIRCQYDAETEKERPTQPSCVMLNTTCTGVCMIVKFKKEANPSCMMFNLTQRQTLPSCMVFNVTEKGKHYHLF